MGLMMRYYEAIHNHYENGHWKSEKFHLFKTTKPANELNEQIIAKAIGVNYNPNEDCIWWDEIKIAEAPEV